MDSQPPRRAVKIVQMFGVSLSVGYYWIEHNIAPARREAAGSAWLIALNAEKKAELRRWVE